MNPYIALTRPGNVVLTAVAVVAGSFIAAGDSILDFQVEIVIASLAAMMLVGGGNALNDYNDRESDKENHPNRPIPAGLINADEALVYSRILLSVGLLIVLFGLANKLPFIIALIGTVTLISYENNLKALGLSGNMAVGFMSGAVFLYAGMVVNDPGPTLWMFGLAFLATVAREIVKDIQDLEGDTDRLTLPARIGITKSLFFAGSLLAVAWSLSFTAITQFSGIASNAYAIGVSIANVIMLVGFQNARNGDYFSGQKKIKQGMGVAMLAFIAAAGCSYINICAYMHIFMNSIIFKALGNETRLKIIETLLIKEHNVSDLTGISDKDQTTISRHLIHLKQAKLITQKKIGRNVIYSIANSQIYDWLVTAIKPNLQETETPSLRIKIKDYLDGQTR